MDGGLDYSGVLGAVEPFLKKLAAETYSRHGWRIQSYEDLYQTLVYLVMYAVDIYKPSKGDLIPHVINVVRLKLRSMLAGEYAPRSRDYPFTFLSVLVVEAGLD